MKLYTRILLSALAALLLLPCTLVAEDEAKDGQWREKSEQMVRQQLKSRGIEEPRVLEAMRSVPRHEFVPDRLQQLAYSDRPLPIGHGQTISQPYIVALMAELAQIQEQDRVLEGGTGSGYHAAVLAELGKEVYSVEIIEGLAKSARRRLQRLGYANTRVLAGDGFQGWPEYAPFDAIVVTCAPPEVPDPLKEQLAPGGNLVIPVGEQWQELKVLHKKEKGSWKKENVVPVRFVPMTGPGVRGL